MRPRNAIIAVFLLCSLSPSRINAELDCAGLEDTVYPLKNDLGVRHEFGHNRGSGTHKGRDLFATPGSEILAFASGEIVDAQASTSKHNLGGIVIILHRVTLPDGSKSVFHTQYGHLQLDGVRKLRKLIQASNNRISIKKGELIPFAKTGQTGNAWDQALSEAHLHFEVINNCKVYPSKRKCNAVKVDPRLCSSPKLDIKITSIIPAKGSTMPADRSKNIYVNVASSEDPFPSGIKLQAILKDSTQQESVIREMSLRRTGRSRISIRIRPNLWPWYDQDVTFRIVSENKPVHDTTTTFRMLYNWGAVNRGPWEVSYTWVRDWKSKTDPGQTVSEQHRGAGYVGGWSYRVAPFSEQFTRTAWVNEYDFANEDSSGCSYLSIGPSRDLIHLRIMRSSCFVPDVGSFMMYGYIKPQTGSISFVGPEGPKDKYSGELSFKRKGNTDYPKLKSNRTFTSDTQSSVWTIKFEINLRRIPFDEWPP